MSTAAHDKASLQRVANDIRYAMLDAQLDRKINFSSTTDPSPSNSDGWFIRIGTIRNSLIRIELWLDRYARLDHRNFWFGFKAKEPHSIQKMIDVAPKSWKPTTTFNQMNCDEIGKGTWLLDNPLSTSLFHKPIHEEYPHSKNFFYGIYDDRSVGAKNVSKSISMEATAFFLGMPDFITANTNPEVSTYPREENRRLVRMHLARERNRSLAAQCKIRDGYQCQVCEMRFCDVYGDLGNGYAEAHHIVPLHKLRGTVRNTVDDLITVCANCHRMLDKMDGKKDDVPKLKRLLIRHAVKLNGLGKS